jgi:hypothetical protein
MQNQDSGSSSDSSCSFHSAKPSLLSSSGDSMQDLDKNLSGWSLNDNSDNIWSTCIWNQGLSAFEKPGK